MTDASIPYNPLDTRNLGASVAEALLERSAVELGTLAPFRGAGIYCIYYQGDFQPYRPIANQNKNNQYNWPIYVGKAVPAGTRKANSSAPSGRWLHGRLREHADSIRAVGNLTIETFSCRFLVVEEIWIPLAESVLIAAFSPIWNRLVDGFGNHDPGAGRYNGMRPRWDVLHPGRAWAEKCRDRPETTDVIISEIEAYLRSSDVPARRPRLLAP